MIDNGLRNDRMGGNLNSSNFFTQLPPLNFSSNNNNTLPNTPNSSYYLPVYSPQTQQVQQIQSPYFSQNQGFYQNNTPTNNSHLNNDNIPQTNLQLNQPQTSNLQNKVLNGNNINNPLLQNRSFNSNLLSNINPLSNSMNNTNNTLAPINSINTSNTLINSNSLPNNTNSYPFLAGSSSALYGLNGLAPEGLSDLGGEENEELRKMNISNFNSYIPSEETQTEKKDEEEDTTYDQKEPVLQNVISTFSLDCKLDLQKIQKKARNTEYHPKRFAALVMRIKVPQTTALIFSSGKVVVTGAKNESESKLACKKFARIVKKLDFPATFKDFKIQNIVASCEVGYKVSLETLVSSEHGNSCRFEPELFPGLIYKMIEPKVTLLIFVSGKIVITGAKTKKGVEQAFKNISPVLINFKK